MSKYTMGIILVTLGSCLFSPGGVFLAYAPHASALTGLFYRLIIGAIIAVLYLRICEKTTWYDIFIPQTKATYVLMISGLLMQYLFIVALKYMSTVNVFGLYALSPILGALTNAIVFKQRVSFVTAISAILCLLGMTYAFYDQFSMTGTFILGLIYSLGGVFAGFVVFIILKKDPNIKGISAFAQSWVIGTIALLPFIDYNIHINEVSWLSMGGLTTAIGYAVLAVGPKYIMPSETTILLQIETILGVFFGWLFLGDTVTHNMFIGLIVAIFSVILNSSYSLYHQYRLRDKIHHVHKSHNTRKAKIH